MKPYAKIMLGAAALAAGALSIAISASGPVEAQPRPPGDGYTMRGSNMCLNLTYLRNSQAVSNRQIVYYMKNGEIWRNDLATPCPDLVTHAAGSYSQVSHDNWICANTQQITVRTGMVCRLGQFTRVN